MERYGLVVSDPPHGDVDARRGAELLGLAQAEVLMKAGSPAPEVWLALDEEGATAAAEALTAIGLSVFAVSGEELSSVPWSLPVLSFAFREDGLHVDTAEGEVAFPYDVPITGVFGTLPPEMEGHGSSASRNASSRTTWGRRSTSLLVERVAGQISGRRDSGHAPLGMTSLDLYLTHGGQLHRLSMSDTLTDFSGLEEIKLPRARDNMVTCVLECERRFPLFDVDTRLTNVRPRRRPTVGQARAVGDEGRKLLSFGTRGLMELLGRIDAELEAVSHFELGSRLSHLAQRKAALAPVAD